MAMLNETMDMFWTRSPSEGEIPRFDSDNILSYLASLRKDKNATRGRERFREGYIHNVFVTKPNGSDRMYLKAKCGQKTYQHCYDICVELSRSTADVVKAECTCNPYRKHTAACKHVVGLLYEFDDFWQSGLTELQPQYHPHEHVCRRRPINVREGSR
ncbi:uncharacterized protein [Haliotis cracherodii]|uniref:uncharacterized protein n=2 Tax=Haliotis TaxID=6452 RepID=UPI0039EB59AD